MIPTDFDTDPHQDPTSENEGVFTPGLMRAQDLGADSGASSTQRSAVKQYVLLGGVVVAGIAVLWFLRQQGVGADLLFADTPKIDYNLDQPVDEQAEARQRRVMGDLSMGEGPVQIPSGEVANSNIFGRCDSPDSAWRRSPRAKSPSLSRAPR